MNKIKKWDKFKGLNKRQIILKKIKQKLYLMIRDIINISYHKRLNKYSGLKKLLDESRKNKMAADISDCIAVYEDILSLKPNYILELGPGTSTAAICLAINEIREIYKDYSPTFIAIESRKEWLKYHQENLPSNLQQNVKLMLSDELTSTFNGEEVAYYEFIPSYPYDYIHVDGPDIHGLGVDLQRDLISLEKDLSENCVIVFDGRKNASRFSRKNMNNFKFRRHSKTLNHIISKKPIKNGFLFDFLIKD